MHQQRYAPQSVYEAPVIPFSSAEEAWFWFVRCQRIRREGARFVDSAGGMARPCDPDDIYRAAIRLARQGMISPRHLAVLATFGSHERPPDARRCEEQRASRLWDEALDRLSTVLREKGIVE